MFDRPDLLVKTLARKNGLHVHNQICLKIHAHFMNSFIGRPMPNNCGRLQKRRTFILSCSFCNGFSCLHLTCVLYVLINTAVNKIKTLHFFIIICVQLSDGDRSGVL